MPTHWKREEKKKKPLTIYEKMKDRGSGASITNRSSISGGGSSRDKDVPAARASLALRRTFQNMERPTEAETPATPPATPYYDPVYDNHWDNWPIMGALERVIPSDPEHEIDPRSLKRLDPTLHIRQWLTKKGLESGFFKPHPTVQERVKAAHKARLAERQRPKGGSFEQMFDATFLNIDAGGETGWDIIKAAGKVVGNVLTGERPQLFDPSARTSYPGGIKEYFTEEGVFKDVEGPRIFDPEYGEKELLKAGFTKEEIEEGGRKITDVRGRLLQETLTKRPFMEQIAISFIDPFIVVGLVKKAGLLAKGLYRLAIRKAGRVPAGVQAAYEAEQRKEARRQERAKLTWVEQVPEDETLLEFIDPRLEGQIATKMTSWIDPSAKIKSLEEGSNARIAYESEYAFARTVKWGQEQSAIALAKLNTLAKRYGLANEAEVWGLGPGDQLRATKVTKGRKHTATEVEDLKFIRQQREVSRINETTVESRSRKFMLHEEVSSLDPLGPSTRNLAIRSGDDPSEVLLRISAEPTGKAPNSFLLKVKDVGATRPLSKAAMKLLDRVNRGVFRC
jgi:hypothetical protein